MILGVGPGLYTTRFSEQGAVVTGIDLSKRSLDYARAIAAKSNLHIDYVLKNYSGFYHRQKI